MNELQSLSQIFQNKLFRIPDYQRVKCYNKVVTEVANKI